MLAFIIYPLLKKTSTLFSSLLAVITVTFFLMHSIPGSPFADDKLDAEISKALAAHYGLDQPLWLQYVKYLKNICVFDLGPSLHYQGRAVKDVIINGFPTSFVLGLEAMTLAILAGVGLGMISAANHLKWQDCVSMLFATFCMSLPSFILATLLQFVFAMKLDLLPVARWGSFEQSIMPALSLAALPTAFIARLTRVNLIEAMQQDYILTARAKGLSQMQIIYKHALRNAIFPVLSYLAPLSANIFIGSFAIERIFAIPGLGHSFVQSIINRDYSMIMGLTIFYSCILLLAVWIVDTIYIFLDPRLKDR
ncbi:MAG TPA: ABC transporter permease [Candidatus Rhabdochlamydia sp.]|jgi:oligopeptide transport system permease protein|nr:ABC transporter permease [Candidatus Rhabdochlamydia sp.]